MLEAYDPHRLPIHDDPGDDIREPVVSSSKRKVSSPPFEERVLQRRRVAVEEAASSISARSSPAMSNPPPAASQVPRCVFCLGLLANAYMFGSTPVLTPAGGNSTGREATAPGNKRKVSSPSDAEPVTQRRRVIRHEAPAPILTLSDDDDESMYGVPVSDTGYQSTPRSVSTTRTARALPQQLPHVAHLSPDAPLRAAPGTRRHQANLAQHRTENSAGGLRNQQHIGQKSDSDMLDLEGEDEGDEEGDVEDEDEGKNARAKHGQSGVDARYYDENDSELEYFLAPKV